MSPGMAKNSISYLYYQRPLLLTQEAFDVALVDFLIE